MLSAISGEEMLGQDVRFGNTRLNPSKPFVIGVVGNAHEIWFWTFDVL